MLKKTITYKNLFTDEEVTEDFYFHLSKADLVEMQVENHAAAYTSPKTGQKFVGMAAHLQRISDSQDGPTVMREFKALLRRAYLKRVGDKPVKSKEIWEEFVSSEAYSELIYELLTDGAKAAEFFRGMVPGNFEEQMAQVTREAEARMKAEAQSETPALEKASTALETEETQDARVSEIDSATPDNPVALTQAEMVAMDGDDLQSGLATGRFKLA